MVKYGGDQANMDPLQHANASFVMRQLLAMFAYVDFSDVHGKKTLQKLCHELLSRRDYDYLFEAVMGVYKLLYPQLQQRINQIVELISDIRDPSGVLTQQQRAAAAAAALAATTSAEVPMDQDGESSTGGCAGMDGSVPTIIDQTIVEEDAQAGANFDPHEIKMKISELKFKRFKLKDDFDNLYKGERIFDEYEDHFAKLNNL